MKREEESKRRQKRGRCERKREKEGEKKMRKLSGERTKVRYQRDPQCGSDLANGGDGKSSAPSRLPVSTWIRADPIKVSAFNERGSEGSVIDVCNVA